MAKTMSKSELVQKIVEQHPTEIARKDVKGVIEAVAEIGYKELKKTGAFVVPGFAKLVVVRKPATKARKGLNPFTKEPTIFKAKPACGFRRLRPGIPIERGHAFRSKAATCSEEGGRGVVAGMVS